MRYVLSLIALLAFPSMGNAQVRAQVLACDTSAQLEQYMQLTLNDGIEHEEALKAVNHENNRACMALALEFAELGNVKKAEYGGKDYEIVSIVVLRVLGGPPIMPFAQFVAKMSAKQGVKM